MSLDINWWCVRFCKDNSNFCSSRDSHTTVKFVLHEIVSVQIIFFVTRDTLHCFRKENKRNVQNLSCIIFVSTFSYLCTSL